MDWKKLVIWAFKFLYAGGIGLFAGGLTWIVTANALCGGIVLIMAFLTKKYALNNLISELSLKHLLIAEIGCPIVVGLEMILVVGAYKLLGWEFVLVVSTILAFSGLAVDRKINPSIASQ